MAPRRPKLVTPDQTPRYVTWDQYVEEATADIEPYVLPLPPDPANPDADPGTAEIPCPSGEQMQALASAQTTGDDAAAFVAIFGEELAPRLLTATAKLPFFVRAKMVGEVMMHYGQQAAPGGGLGD